MKEHAKALLQVSAMTKMFGLVLTAQLAQKDGRTLGFLRNFIPVCMSVESEPWTRIDQKSPPSRSPLINQIGWPRGLSH